MASEFPSWLRQTMVKAHLSQVELANQTGVTRSAINNILMERKVASPKLLVAMAKILHVTPEFIFIKAGLLPQGKTVSKIDQIIMLMSHLPESDHQDVIDYINMKIIQKEQKQ